MPAAATQACKGKRYNRAVKHLLLDLDDTLLDYSGGVDECWSASCATGCDDGTIEASALVRARCSACYRAGYRAAPATNAETM